MIELGKNTTATPKNINGVVTFNKKTGEEIKLLIGQCSICNRQKSKIVSNNTIEAEGLSEFFQEFE